jgi:hypothetical protein
MILSHEFKISFILSNYVEVGYNDSYLNNSFMWLSEMLTSKLRKRPATILKRRI